MERIEHEHACVWRERVEALEHKAARVDEVEEKLSLVMSELDQLRKKVFGPKSERMPSVSEELRKERRRRGEKADPKVTAAKRKASKAAREDAAIEEHSEARVPEEQRSCPSCGDEAKSISTAKTSEVWGYVPGYFRRRVIHRETVACSCGDYIATAPAPPRVLGQSKYDASFLAHLVVWKVCDSVSIYRAEKRFKRLGVPVARTTMNDLMGRCGFAVRILHRRMLELIAEQSVVLADETTLPVVAPKKCRRGFIWTFSARAPAGDGEHVLVAFRYSKTRSGQTPASVLGGTTGVLVVDGYSGYNAVSCPEGRQRAACLAHVRRKFFDARSTAPAEVDQALALILDVYRIEHEALERGIARKEEHLVLRQARGRPAMEALHAWLVDTQPRYPPRSAVGKAIAHALNNWERLTVFLDDAAVPIDNNESERFLRPVAKGRDAWLFAGNDEAAENIAALMTLTSACEANGINPEAYLTDVLARLEFHPATDLDALLPHNWQPQPDP
jgi:transposase